MESNCDEMKNQIADFITGILPKQEAQALQQHLSECSACRDYAESLEREEQLLTGFFAKFDEDIARWEAAAIDTVNRFDASSKTNVVSIGNTIMKDFLIKHAAVAVVIVFVTVYFIVTLTWISQINECMRLVM